MSEVRRYMLDGGRELRTTLAHGQLVIAIHDAAANRVASVGIRPGELGVVRRALADLSRETVSRKRLRAGTT